VTTTRLLYRNTNKSAAGNTKQKINISKEDVLKRRFYLYG
jgi:hypothetical protein